MRPGILARILFRSSRSRIVIPFVIFGNIGNIVFSPKSCKMTLTRAWEILGLSDQASFEEAKKKYRKLTLTHHPDRGGESGVMAELNSAWELIEEFYKVEVVNTFQFTQEDLYNWAEDLLGVGHYQVILHMYQPTIPEESVVVIDGATVYSKPFGPRQTTFWITGDFTPGQVLDLIYRYGVKPQLGCDLQMTDHKLGAWVTWRDGVGWRSISFRKTRKRR